MPLPLAFLLFFDSALSFQYNTRWPNRQTDTVLLSELYMTSETTPSEWFWEISYKLKYKHKLTGDSLTAHLAIYPNKLNLCSHKNLHRYFYSSFMDNCQNLGATKMCFNGWMCYIHTMEYFSVIKRKKLSIMKRQEWILNTKC